MWAATSLHIRLIDHLLQAGVFVHKQDSTERTALHYVALPSEDAASSDMDGKCVQRPTRNDASITTSINKVETFLQLLAGPKHAALDPRFSRLYTTHGEILEDDQ